jgi:GTP cyclohydrolase IA
MFAAVQERSPTIARLGNESVGHLSVSELAYIKAAAEKKIQELFDILCIDHRNDHNTRDTPRRVAKMLVEEILRGRYASPPRITAFENVTRFDQLIITGPIDVRSTCAHHLLPIHGEAFVGILPSADGKVIGLSKYDRIVDYFCARLQIQEELVNQLTKYIAEITRARGLAVRISAEHMCKTHRGVRSRRASRMVNTCYYGEMLVNTELQQHFLQETFVLSGRIAERAAVSS